MRNKNYLNIKLIAQSTWLEFLRRKDIFVILIFMLIYLLAVFVVRLVGIESNETVRFLLNLGLTISVALVGFLTIFASSRQIPNEIENKTVYPLFAKPISRTDYIIGKVLSISLLSSLLLLALVILTLICVPHLPGLDNFLLFQMIILQIFSIIILTSLGILLSLLMPKSAAIVVLLIIYIGGKILRGFIRIIFGKSIFEEIAFWIVSYIPNFSQLNLVQRYTDCAPPLDISLFILIIIYCLIIIYTFLIISKMIFERRSL